MTRSIGAGLLVQALVRVALGAILGGLFSLALAATLDAMVPTIALSIAPSDAATALLLFMAAGVLAALLPVARLGDIDPLEAFRR